MRKHCACWNKHHCTKLDLIDLIAHKLTKPRNFYREKRTSLLPVKGKCKCHPCHQTRTERIRFRTWNQQVRRIIKPITILLQTLQGILHLTPRTLRWSTIRMTKTVKRNQAKTMQHQLVQNHLETVIGLKHWTLNTEKKCIIEDGHWVCDKVINAALTLLRSVYTTVNGLSDAIYATRYGFPPSTADEHFVQIISVRGNHWVTISNVQSNLYDTYIYDSLVGINKKRDKDSREGMSYPLVVEQATFMLSRPPFNVNVHVLEVQQQKGGNDCGLFAIAFTVALCQGRDPVTLKLTEDKSVCSEEGTPKLFRNQRHRFIFNCD